MSVTKLRGMVQRGRDGRNLGLDLGAGRANRYLNRFQRARYLLIGGDSGVGKTTVSDAMLFAMLNDAITTGRKVHVKYFSFELSKEDKMMSWICMLMAHKLGFECTPDYIFGRIELNQLKEEHYQLYLEMEALLEEVYLPLIDLIDYPMTPTAMFNHVLEFYDTIGVVEREPDREGKDGKPVKGRLVAFHAYPEWEEAFVIGVIDHVALGMAERGQDLKRMIDSISRKVVISRNMLAMSWIVVQQFNTEMNSTHRNMTSKKSVEALIAPNRLDFGDSKYTFRDADWVFGLVSPRQFALKTFMGYNVELMQSFLTVAYLMKNRYGPDLKVLPLFVNPLARSIRDMPPAVHEPAMDAIYLEAQKLQERCLLYFPPEEGQL